jgi:hypothetical protein
VARREWHYHWTHETSRVWPLLIVTAVDDMWLAAQFEPTDPNLGGDRGPGDPVVVGGRGDPEQPPIELDVEWQTSNGEVHRQIYRRPAGT